MEQNEFREDPLTGELVIISSGRSKRPSDFKHEKSKRSKKKVDKKCFFCPGNEDLTPPTIDKRGKKWRIRVFENKFPAVTDRVRFRMSSGLFRSSAAYGHHEIIVETREHWKQPQDMSTKALRELLEMYQKREKAQYDDEKIKSAIIFRNHLQGGGASIAHSHSQVVSLPVVYPRLATKKKKFDSYMKKKGSCIYCDTIMRERLDVRLVKETKNYVLLAPFASKWAFQTMVLPKEHGSAFYEADLRELNKLLSSLFKTYDKMLDNPPYNYFIHSSPADFHWHFEFWPVLQTPAGLEKGGDLFINTESPDDAADELRRSWVR